MSATKGVCSCGTSAVGHTPIVDLATPFSYCTVSRHVLLVHTDLPLLQPQRQLRARVGGKQPRLQRRQIVHHQRPT